MTRKQMLRDALVALSLSAEGQLEHLRRLGPRGGVDELALDYDGIAAAADDMREKAELTRVQGEAVLALNAYLKSMSGARNSHLWTHDALRTSKEWSDVRRMATLILGLLADSARAP